MIKLYVQIFALVLLLAPAVALAQEASSGGDDNTQSTVIKAKDYTAGTVEEDTSEEEATSETDQISIQAEQEEKTDCTSEDRRKLEDYDAILTSYYQDTKYISQNQEKFESLEEVEKLQKNMEVYSDFISSDDYKKSIKLRELCNMPAPPRPYNWPSFIPVPDPMDVSE